MVLGWRHLLHKTRNKFANRNKPLGFRHLQADAHTHSDTGGPESGVGDVGMAALACAGC